MVTLPILGIRLNVNPSQESMMDSDFVKRERIQWSKYRGDWTGNSPRYGPVKIQHSRKARRYYLMTNRILEAPIVLGDYATRAEAVAEAER